MRVGRLLGGEEQGATHRGGEAVGAGATVHLVGNDEHSGRATGLRVPGVVQVPVIECGLTAVKACQPVDGMALPQPEWNAVLELLMLRREQLTAEAATFSGLNAGLNSGEVAGQTLLHTHWHLIPRQAADCEEPSGGSRGVSSGMQKSCWNVCLQSLSRRHRAQGCEAKS